LFVCVCRRGIEQSRGNIYQTAALEAAAGGRRVCVWTPIIQPSYAGNQSDEACVIL